MTTAGESYVVRIYRRDPDSPGHVAGVVQRTDGDQNYAFHTVAELLQLLALERASPGGALSSQRKRGR